MVNEIYPMNGSIYTPNELLNWVTATEPLFFPLIMIAIWVITFIATKGYTASRAWTMASFVCFILAMPLVAVGWMSAMYMYMLLVMVAAGVVWMRLGDSTF